MRKPKRYWMDDQNDADFPYECTDGAWVKWEDYARLKAKVNRLTKAGDMMAKLLSCCGNPQSEVRDWNAAKEGKHPWHAPSP
jgi:hypothetical protein